MSTLGMFYVEYGKRIGRQDPSRGAELFRRCTEETLDANCAFAYGTALDLGVGVLRDPVRSYAMFLVASSNGPLAKTRTRLDEIGKSLSQAETARAHTIANQLLASRKRVAPAAQIRE